MTLVAACMIIQVSAAMIMWGKLGVSAVVTITARNMRAGIRLDIEVMKSVRAKILPKIVKLKR